MLFAECRLFIVMLSVIMLINGMLSVITPLEVSACNKNTSLKCLEVES